jgi:hypothetical protein
MGRKRKNGVKMTDNNSIMAGREISAGGLFHFNNTRSRSYLCGAKRDGMIILFRPALF